jgi:hypothetical protein
MGVRALTLQILKAAQVAIIGTPQAGVKPKKLT